MARQAVVGAADALFISCTNLPTYDAIPQLEAELRMPVLSANQVTMWAALRRIGAHAVGPYQGLLLNPPPVRHVPTLEGLGEPVEISGIPEVPISEIAEINEISEISDIPGFAEMERMEPVQQMQDIQPAQPGEWAQPSQPDAPTEEQEGWT
jgi:maleate isomerase